MADVFGFPFPWSDRDAQNLHRTLTDLCPNVRNAEQVAREAGLDTTDIDWQQSAKLVWAAILDSAARLALTQTLVERMFEAHAKTPRGAFLDGLLKQKEGQKDVDRARGLDDVVKHDFIRGSDDVLVPEALLFNDDLTILVESDVVRLIATLSAMLKLSRAVCLVRAQTLAGMQAGTGFRVGPKLLLTNHHVVHDKQGNLASKITAEFDYQDNAEGDGLATKVIKCNAAKTVADAKYDWALVTVTDPLDEAWPIIDLSRAVAPVQAEPAFIIQHPMGNRKALAFVRNQITNVDEEVVHYLTDTQTGSSGSPVFNAKGELIALHHAGGWPQEVAGKMPVKKNEGIRISKILEGLFAQGISLD